MLPINTEILAQLHAAGADLHLDLVCAAQDLEATLKIARPNLILSLGVLDSRNIWRADLRGIASRLQDVIAKRGADTVQIAPSCSLLHVPIVLESEHRFDPEIRQMLAFAVQKRGELAALADRHEAADAQSHRHSPFDTRLKLQAEHLKLPLYPTTTIGSFPQTAEVRQARSRYTKGELNAADYQNFLEQENETAIRCEGQNANSQPYVLFRIQRH